SGGTNYYPFYPSNDTIEQLDKLLAPFTEDEPVYQVSLRIMKEILSHIESDDDFRVTAFISILEMMLSEKPNAQGLSAEIEMLLKELAHCCRRMIGHWAASIQHRLC
nr:hypothetical protein [Trichococcus flocculiformis]